MKNAPIIYLIHHNQPILLESQILIFRRIFPESQIVVGLTCHLRVKNHRADEMFRIVKKYNLRVIESDTGRSMLNRLIQYSFSRLPLRPIILRIPFLRKNFGQDPSSGHARLLNKLWQDLLNQSKGSQVWLIEGDVFPIKRINQVSEEYWLEGITEFSSFKGQVIEYLNPRIIGLRLSPQFLDFASKHRFDWSPLHTFSSWRDTGSRTYEILALLNSLGKFNILESSRSGNWTRTDKTFLEIESDAIREALISDPRNRDGNKITCDFYGSSWIHIGKMSGYFVNQPENLNKAILEVLKPIWKFE